MTFNEILVVISCFLISVFSIVADYFLHTKLVKRVEKLEADVKSLLKGYSDV